MRATSVMRFILFGAAGFGIGATLVWPLLGVLAFPLTGAVGGAALGLALKDWARVVILALLGVLGLTVGITGGPILGSFFNYSEVPVAAIVGLGVGASLGAATLDWKRIVALAVAGATGFGVGLLAGEFLWSSFLFSRGVGEDVFIVIAGVVGGASLGAALAYLESRKLAAEQRPRVG